MSKIEKDKKTKCWNFIGAIDYKGYGKISRKGKMVYVHRYMFWYYNIKPLGTSWEEFSESCSDLDVCHHCDNPPCCNPKHLFLGTRIVNMRDSVKKGRIAKGEDHGKHKLTEKEVLKIYRMKGTQQEIADKFRISQQNVSAIKTGSRFGWLTQKHQGGI